MMRVIAVSSPVFGSRVIRWGLGEPASHLAVEVHGNVFHSELKGAHWQASKEFWATHDLVDEAPFPGAPLVLESRIVAALCSELKGVTYDEPAFRYFAWRAFLKKVFRIPLPKRNDDDRSDRLICVEVLYAFVDAYVRITGITPVRDLPKTLGIMTPMEAVAYAKEAFPCASALCFSPPP